MSNQVEEPSPEPPARLDEDALSALMTEANQRYDRSDFEGALEIAEQVLSHQPDKIRARRVAISSACLLGLADRARALAPGLPARDREQMRIRCLRWGIEL